MDKPGEGITPPVDSLLEFATAAAELQRIYELDVIWTAAEKLGGDMRVQDKTALANLGARVETDLQRAEPHLSTMQRILTDFPAWFDAAVSNVLDGEQFTDAQRSDVRRLLGADGAGYAERGIALIEEVRARLPEERASLRGKIGSLRGDGPIVTDMSAETACAIGTVIAMAELAGCVAFDAVGLCIIGGGLLVLAAHAC